MKRGTSKKILFSSLLVFILLEIVLISAAGSTASANFAGNFKTVADAITSSVQPFFQFLFGNYNDSGAFSYQILTFILVALICYAVLDNSGLFSDRHWINVAIGIIVALLGIRFLPTELIAEAAMPSGALTLTLLLVVPVIIAGYLISRFDNPYIRRALWAVFAAVIVFLWIYNLNNTALGAASWLYPLIALFCLLAFAFDGTLHRFLSKGLASATVERTKNIERDKLTGEIKTLVTALGSATTARDRNRIRKEIEQKQKALNAI